MKMAQDRQKSYADKRRRPLEFEVGDFVFLKVSPRKGVIRFRNRGKLHPRYIARYKIIGRVGEVAYRLELPPEMERIHNVFHVSMLKKCLTDSTQVIEAPLEEVELREDLSFQVKPIAILDSQVKKLRSKEVPMVKVLWKNDKVEEMTWETEEMMKRDYPELFEMTT